MQIKAEIIHMYIYIYIYAYILFIHVCGYIYYVKFDVKIAAVYVSELLKKNPQLFVSIFCINYHHS